MEMVTNHDPEISEGCTEVSIVGWEATMPYYR